MLRFRTSIFLVLASASTSYAQYMYQRRTPIWRVITGCIVGGLFVIFFICLCMMMARRRRARSFAMTGSAPPSNFKSLFGGPWGGTNNEYYGQNALPMNAYSQGQGQNPYNGANSNSEYPDQHEAIPPPAYGKDAQYNNQYSRFQGPPPQGQGTSQQAPYSPPPGPPPPAHTIGQDNTFFGGFRP